MSEDTARFVALGLFGLCVVTLAVCGIIHIVKTFAPFALTITIGG